MIPNAADPHRVFRDPASGLCIAVPGPVTTEAWMQCLFDQRSAGDPFRLVGGATFTDALARCDQLLARCRERTEAEPAAPPPAPTLCGLAALQDGEPESVARAYHEWLAGSLSRYFEMAFAVADGGEPCGKGLRGTYPRAAGNRSPRTPD
jgi:hypothetical protein